MYKTAFEQGQVDALESLGLLKEAVSRELILRAIKGRAKRDLGTRDSGGAWTRWRNTLHAKHPAVANLESFNAAKKALLNNLKQNSMFSAPRAWTRATDPARLGIKKHEVSADQFYKKLQDDMGVFDYEKFLT
jgi:hypothetical protein